MTDAEVKAGLSELHAVGLTIYGEARSEQIEGKVFVGCVIRNRFATPRRFGDSYSKVCLAKSQFSCWWLFGGRANYDHVMLRARLFVGDYAERPAGVMDTALAESIFVAEGIIGGQLQDRARSATHYITKALWKAAPPLWAQGKTPVVECGSHVGFIVN